MSAPASAMVWLWRIGSDTPTYTAEDVTGIGAEQTGGRWNRKGTRMVYAATSRALACLETLVHLNSGDLPLNRYLVEIRVPNGAWAARAQLDPAALVGWDAEPAGMVSLDWGTTWAATGATLLAEVPSVIVPEERNVLINPAHTDAVAVSAIKIRKWTYDGRLRPTLKLPGWAAVSTPTARLHLSTRHLGISEPASARRRPPRRR